MNAGTQDEIFDILKRIKSDALQAFKDLYPLDGNIPTAKQYSIYEIYALAGKMAGKIILNNEVTNFKANDEKQQKIKTRPEAKTTGEIFEVLKELRDKSPTRPQRFFQMSQAYEVFGTCDDQEVYGIAVRMAADLKVIQDTAEAKLLAEGEARRLQEERYEERRRKMLLVRQARSEQKAQNPLLPPNARNSRNREIYWERVAGRSFAEIGRNRGLSGARTRQIFAKETRKVENTKAKILASLQAVASTPNANECLAALGDAFEAREHSADMAPD